MKIIYGPLAHAVCCKESHMKCYTYVTLVHYPIYDAVTVV